MENVNYSRRQYVMRLASTTAGIATFGSTLGMSAKIIHESLEQMKRLRSASLVAVVWQILQWYLFLP